VSRPVIRAVLFDFDGTLTRPEAIDFAALRALIQVPAGTPILEYIQALPSAEEQARRLRILEDFEAAAARKSVPNAGAERTLRVLKDRGLKLGISSRNSRSSIDTALANFSSISHADFQVILTRENSGRQKPHPDGALKAAGLFGISPAEMLVVGDFVFDIAAGHAAGATTVLITNGSPAAHMDPPPHHVIQSLPEITEILDAVHPRGE
jgi:hydrogenase expression/formation protein HypE